MRLRHVVRCFDDDNVIHVAGKIDPISDIEVINTELALADLGTAEKALLRQQKLPAQVTKTRLNWSRF